MGFIKHFHSNFFFLYIIIKQFIPVLNEVKIFPDHISSGDPIFNKSQVYSTTNERFIYKLGYFTNTPNPEKIFSKKYGIYYEPVTCIGGTGLSYSDSDTSTFFQSNIIGDKVSTTTKGMNFFEEIELFKKVMSGTEITCNSHLKIVHSSNLKITYIIPVLSTTANNNFKLYAIPPNTDPETEICNIKLEANKIKMVQIDIKTDIENTFGAEVRMVFTCTDSTKKAYIKSYGDEYYNFKYTSTDTIYLSNFRITVEDTLIITGLESNKILLRSKNGLSSPNSCKKQNTDEDCFRGHVCIIDTCRKCHYSCSSCYNSDSYGSCEKCSPLTISENQDPINGLCPINFVDISQFKDFYINIEPYGNEFNERATIGLWLFFADLTGSRSLEYDIYHIVLENRIVISLYPGDDKLTAYCHTYEDLYRKVTSDTKLYSSYADKSSDYVAAQVIPGEGQARQKDGLDIETMNGKWFHISCAISFPQERYYIKSVVNGIPFDIKKDLPHERLYPGSGDETNEGKNDDVYYNHILNKGEPLVLWFKNFGNSNAKIYAKHFMFFKEYIDVNMQYMYYDFMNIIPKNFPEILFQLPFDELINQGSYKLIGYQYDTGVKKDISVPLLLSHSGREDFEVPLNFYRLLLNDPNEKYNSIDLIDKTNLVTSSPPNGFYYYDDQKILNCKDGYFYTDETCDSNCKSGYITYPGVSVPSTNGYCSYICMSTQTCSNDVYKQTDITINNFNYKSNKFCSDYKAAYNLFFECVDPTKNYSMQYSGFYNSQLIKIDLKKELKSYIIEFWFYPDFFLQAKARQYQYTFPTYPKNFFFHSNVMDCYFVQTDRLVPYLYDSSTVKRVESLYNSNEWNKFVIHGKYLKDKDDYIKTVYINHAFDQPFTFPTSKASAYTSLTQIVFCENKCQDINNENIHWTTGYYKGLRIWDGDLASYSEVVQYDELYPIDLYQDRINSILCYYPLLNQYITNNELIDLDETKDNECTVSIEKGTYNLKKYNYGTKFDIIGGNGLLGKYSQHGSDPAFIDTCDTGCLRCWERTFCYECDKGKKYFLSGRKCLLTTKYYFLSPKPDKSDYTVNLQDVNDGVTITIWTKPIGFDEYNQLIFTIGSANPFEIYYSSTDNPAYGLYILGNSANPPEKKIIACESEFRDNIGKWTYISFAYHKQKISGSNIYFPRMIKFEINTDSIPVNIDSTKISNDPNFSTLTISSGYFGLFKKISLYNEFIIQSISLSGDSNQLSPLNTPNPLIENEFGCGYTAGTNCVADEEPDLGLFLDTCSLYQDYLTTTDTCINACSGYGWEKCTCSSKNYNSQMLFKNNNKTLCRPLDYINFAKIKKRIISPVTPATRPRKCTLQFWIFPYAYTPNSFGGIEVVWNGHAKIQFKNCANYKCNFYCYENGSKSDKYEGLSINQWIFLSCAVDYEVNRNLYIDYNTQDNEGTDHTTSGVTGDIDSSQNSLTIEDLSTYDEWGVLFFRQIRLWKNAYYNAKFLSRILIETPSKFPDLLHSWEPVYNGKMIQDYPGANLKVYDIGDKHIDFEVRFQDDGTKYEGLYGMNVIDESKYSILSMCSEDGLYFDITLKKCMQFLDLSKMNDFTFKDLPSAYSGNFALAFWVFFEDVNLYVTNPLHIKWSRHAQITIMRENELRGYCFPQAYYSDYEDETDFNTKYKNALNKADVRLLAEGLPEDGQWIWVICSVSYYERKFFIMGENGKNELEINKEYLYTDNNGQDVTTSYPMRFYLSDLNNNNMYKSTLSVVGINPNRKLFLREILLFRNFIPEWYSEKIKYMNLRDLTDNQLPALAFVVNFADFDLDTKKLKYIYFERGYGLTNYERVESSLLLTVSKPGSTFELSANFEFQSLCDLDTMNPTKYDIDSRICVKIDKCVLQDLRATYCMDEDMPLSCQSGGFYTKLMENDEEKFRCNPTCVTEEFITPGTERDRAICNTNCGEIPKLPENSYDEKCPVSPSTMKCGNGYYRIGYKCVRDNLDSALFFSKCYNSPNFYRTISTNTLNKITSGYFYEFWMKLDRTLIQEKTCKEAGVSSKEYYLYSTPHSIYKDNDFDVFYYQIINSAYKKQITSIDPDLWNKIVIETKIETTGQSVNVHINFEKDIIRLDNIDASITMRLQYISFCSRKSSGDCIPGSSNIMWGSAYYKNIRVWDIKSSSIQTIQDYNSGIYQDISKSLILYYPLTIQYIDSNIIQERISGEDNIIVQHLRSNNFQSENDVINYNYETNLIWDIKHQNECGPEQVLVKEICKDVTGYYLKVPSPSLTTAVQFNIDNIKSKNIFTFCIYMKFIGVLKEGTSAKPIIFSFKDDTYLVYDIATSYAIFYIGGADKEAFRDTKFHDYIGIWTPICMANLISKDPYVHPNMFTLSINKIDIPFTSGFSLPKNGVIFERIAIGTEIIAYFSQFRIYTKFIQGNFGTISSGRREQEELAIFYSLKCEDNAGNVCNVDATFADPTIVPCCVGDYNIYDDSSLQTDNDDQYFDINLDNGNTIGECNDYCKTLCYNSKNNECTCKMTDTVYWLRKDKATLKTYCEHPPYIDYSLFDDISITVPSSNTNESTLEFWFYIYSYNTTTINFKEINIIWDKHNRVQIINEKNSLSARCYAIHDSNDTTRFTDLVQSISVVAFGWTSIRCGTSLNLPTFKQFFNTYERTINPDKKIIPYDRWNSSTTLTISNNKLSPISYGFFFIRELKLWQQYNLNFIDTSYINLSSDSFGLYNKTGHYSLGLYPGLITLIRSEYSIEQYEDAIEGKYHITNLVIEEEEEYPYPRESVITRGKNYIGYNLIDPSNSDYYKTLKLCEEGWVYNSLFDQCEQPSYTKCLYPGDTKDTCMLCPETAKYIHPVDGLCKSECPTGYYERDDMNQCRPCEATCYKCNWTFEFNCTECTGARYLVEHEGRCVEKCEDFNLTASNITNNLCTGFDSFAILTNYKYFDEEEIDLNTFDRLQAAVINYTSRDYTVLWAFEREKTVEVNNGTPIYLPDESPFIGDLTKEEEVLVNNSFFRLATDYVFSLTVIAHNVLFYDAIVNKTHYFHIRINSYPVNGTLTVSPKVGLYRTTFFVLKCENWTDTTSNKLEYRFFAKEVNTNNNVLLRDWSSENEMSSNFSVIYYQQESSDIKITCEIRDELNASTSVSEFITIAKSLNGEIYNLSEAIDSYLSTEKEKSDEKYDVLLYHRSQFLLSLSVDPYKTVYPTSLQTQYEPTLQGDAILMEDPTCVTEYCNGNGDCGNVDEFIYCHCYEGWIGKYCQIRKEASDKLTDLIRNLFYEIRNNLQTSISWYEFMTVYNAFKAASLFFEDTEFLIGNISLFFDYAMGSLPESIANNTQEYFEILDFFYTYEITRMEQLKRKIQVERHDNSRKVNLTNAQMEEFKKGFEFLNEELLTFMRFLSNQNSVTRKSFTFDSENYYLAVISLNPSFDDKAFFNTRKRNYKTYIEFMSCLNYIEIDKLSNQYYQGYLVYIEYYYFPFSYNHTLLENNISPLIEFQILDSTTGKFIKVSGCNGQNRIIIHMPFYSYRYLDEFNYQKLLYDPNIYKSPDDPIFSDPVYIEENGFISDDTIEQRIEKYSRRYNISPNYYDETNKDFSLLGLDYINFTNDLNFMEFSSTHLCRFTNFIIKNNATYHPNGRFYYLFRPRILKYFPNFYQSMGSLILIIMFGIYLFLLFIVLCYDSRLTEKEILLDSIKEEIIKNFYPYAKNIDAIYKRLVPAQMSIKDFKPEIKFGPEANANNNPTGRSLLNVTKSNDIDKMDKLTLKTNVNKLEEEKNGGGDLKIRKKLRKNVINNYVDQKKQIAQKMETEEDKKSEENFMGEIDKEIGNVDRATFNINYLSKDEEKTKEEKDRRVESYSNLKLDACTFFRKNYVIRNILINAVCNVSLFQPRWKKLTMVMTEIAIMILIISVLLTNDAMARIDLDISSIQFLFAYGLAASCISNFVMYFLAIFFEFPYNSARRLFKLVLFNGQLIVMREWGEISNTQKYKAFFGVIFCVIIWAISLYVSLGFTAVWKEQKFDFLLSFAFGVVLNFFIMELIVEGIIALIYKGRKKYKCIKHFGFLLNRLRNYRCLA